MFAFNDQQLRGVRIDGEPWFVASDVCACLSLSGYASWNLQALDDDEKRVVRLSEETSLRVLAKPRGPSLSLVSHPGLFKLIQRSNKLEAMGLRVLGADEEALRTFEGRPTNFISRPAMGNPPRELKLTLGGGTN